MDIQSILEQLKQDRTRLDEAIRALESIGGSPAGKRRGRKPGRHMSADARARIGAAMRKRWAQRKRKAA
jgi:hypothetical protein